MAKVDPLLALSEQSRQAFQALVPIPEFEMVLMDQHVHFQADVFAADGIGVSLDTQDAIRFGCIPLRALPHLNVITYCTASTRRVIGQISIGA